MGAVTGSSQEEHISTREAGEMLLAPPRRSSVPDARPTVSSSGRDLTVLGELARFTAVGAVMTLAYLALYAALRTTLSMQAANAIAWVATAMADTWANRRVTFGVTGRRGALRSQAQGLLVFATGAAITSGALFALGALVARPGEPVQLAVLLAANAAAGLLRFTLLRRWVFAHRRGRQPEGVQVERLGAPALTGRAQPGVSPGSALAPYGSRHG